MPAGGDPAFDAFQRSDLRLSRPQRRLALLFNVLATTNIVYQVEVAHRDPLQLLLVGTVLELTCFVVQVPTGLIADAFSRRWAVAAGFALVGVDFILEGLIPQFAAIALDPGQ